MMTFVNETTFDKLKLPDKIYKYRDWSNPKHKRILTNSEIYFSAPSDTNEQHDCKLETDYASVTPDMIYDYAYKDAESRGKSKEECIAFADWTLRTTKFFEKGDQEYGEKMFRESMNQQLSIFCVSEHNDNLNLWNTFAGGRTGFCVGVNPRKMFDNKEIFGGGGKVDYFQKDKMPKRKALTFSDLESINDMLLVIFSLPDLYKHEDEYRFFKINITNKQATIGQDSIEEIILGSNISSADKEEIIKIARERFPHANILQSLYDAKENTFQFEKIA